jgi:hypothetical protein
MDLSSAQTDFFRPLVSGWVGKLERAVSSRKRWKETADECMMFYSKSAAAMWDPTYAKKFWKGVKPPKFQITINKAFEPIARLVRRRPWRSHPSCFSKIRKVSRSTRC